MATAAAATQPAGLLEDVTAQRFIRFQFGAGNVTRAEGKATGR